MISTKNMYIKHTPSPTDVTLTEVPPEVVGDGEL